MRVLLCPDSYGGFLSSPEAACRMARRFGAAGVEVHLHPMADGGEGTLDVLAWHDAQPEAAPSAFRWDRVATSDPLGRPVDARLALVAGAIWVESAEILGLQRVPPPRDPLLSSSRGLGDVLATLSRSSVSVPVVVGLGGTATLDGGLGLLLGLGFTVLDADGRPLPADAPARVLPSCRRVVGTPPPLGNVEVLWDTWARLEDAPVLYGPQKGLPPAAIGPVRDAFSRWYDVLSAWRAEHGASVLPRDLPGGGAAGGLGFALAALGAGALRGGALHLARVTRLAEAFRDADWVVLGEGRMDRTSFRGKVAEAVLGLAREAGVPRVAALVGEAKDVPAPPAGPDLVETIGGPREDLFDAAVARLVRRMLDA